MGRPAPIKITAALAFLIIALAALTACGAAGSTDGSQARTAGNRKGGSNIGLKRIGDFESPTYVSGAPGSPRLLFVVEQPGRIAVLRGGHRLPKPFLDISNLVSFEGERGLLSLAFPPDYGSSGAFYIYYTDKDGNIRVDEFHRRSAVRADPGSRRNVIEIPHPVNSNHNGGQLQFLGDLLYFGTGDGGSGGDPPNNAQNTNVLLGKLLRIDPRPSGGKPYSVPPSNPFVGRPGRDEIYSYGLRNPFRFSFDTVSSPGSTRLAIGDVGQNRTEEIDYLPVARAAGANFGWDALEGLHPYTEENSGTPDPGGTVKPIYNYSHDRDGSCSVTGGYVVSDPSLRALYKRYLYADFCEGELRILVPHLKGASGERPLGIAVPSPSSFGEDERHHLYVASLEGPVYRLVPR
jgi:glucose/arabinose dehydrogenase